MQQPLALSDKDIEGQGATARIVSCKKGYDMQVWEGGLLKSSQWCLHFSQSEYDLFLRSNSLELNTAEIQSIDSWLIKTMD